MTLSDSLPIDTWATQLFNEPKRTLVVAAYYVWISVPRGYPANPLSALIQSTNVQRLLALRKVVPIRVVEGVHRFPRRRPRPPNAPCHRVLWIAKSEPSADYEHDEQPPPHLSTPRGRQSIHCTALLGNDHTRNGCPIHSVQNGNPEMAEAEMPAVFISESYAKRLFLAHGLDLYALMKRGLPYAQVGYRRKYSLADLARWLDANHRLCPQAVEEPPHRTMTAGKVAIELGVDRRTIGRYVAAGMPHRRTPGGHFRFIMSEVLSWKAKAPDSSSAAASTTLSGRAIAEADRHGREIARHFQEWARRRAEKMEQKKKA